MGQFLILTHEAMRGALLACAQFESLVSRRDLPREITDDSCRTTCRTISGHHVRCPRSELSHGVNHVLNRGDRRELIFLDDADRRRFLETLGEACARTGWQVHAHVLMPNHFHLVARMRAGGDGGGQGGRDRRRRIATAAVEGSRTDDATQGGWGEGGLGGALAGGDDTDGGVDRRAAGDGNARASEPPAVSAEASRKPPARRTRPGPGLVQAAAAASRRRQT